MRLTRAGCACLLVLALALACSGDSEDASPSSEEGGRSLSGAAEGAEGAAGADQAETPDLSQVTGDARERIFTGSVRIDIEDLDEARERTLAIVDDAGGFVFEEQTDRDDATTTLTVKVPPDEFTGVLEELPTVGRVLDQSVETEDVTEQVVDLESRIESAQASLERVRGLFVAATTVQELVELEAALLERETQLETLQGQLRAIQQQVDLSTITVTLEADPPDEDPDPPGFVAGLEGGWNALVFTLDVAVTVLGALLPWSPIIAGLIAVVVFVTRRERRRGRPTS